MSGLSHQELLAGVPPVVPISAEQVRRRAAGSAVYVVLDDDPTGTQSVADLPVLTAWEAEDFAWAFSTGAPAIYVMTNSRSLGSDEAARVNDDVVAAALAAAAVAGVSVAFVSRSDSTLRGHFPLEPTVIADAMAAQGINTDGIVIIPAFPDAGRITVHGTHYAGNTTDGYVPAGETEFARDATFGYRSSSLAAWVEEKTQGAVLADDVLVVDIDVLRTDLGAVVELLLGAHDRQPIVVDCVVEEDLRQFSLALMQAEEAGRHFIYRVGPPFPRARIGQDVHAPLVPAEINASRGEREVGPGGLIVIGSHVALTTRQLTALREQNQPTELVLDAATVSDPARRDAHIAQVVAAATEALASGNVVVSTSRELITGDDPEQSLAISRGISAAVVAVVQQIVAQASPRFVIAKGGITSSDVASKGLGIRRATVVGPMLPGIVSLWSGQDGPAAGIPYIVFAGNVGTDTSLVDVVNKLAL